MAFGSIFLINKDFYFDRDNKRIYFTKANCPDKKYFKELKKQKKLKK